MPAIVLRSTGSTLEDQQADRRHRLPGVGQAERDRGEAPGPGPSEQDTERDGDHHDEDGGGERQPEVLQDRRAQIARVERPSLDRVQVLCRHPGPQGQEHDGQRDRGDREPQIVATAPPPSRPGAGRACCGEAGRG
jgi:hypothetical protein